MTESINFGDLFKTAKKEMELIPDGDYDIVCSQADATKASTGSLMIKVRLKIEGGPQDGRVVFSQIVLTMDNPNALAMWFRQMAAFGLTDSFWTGNPSMSMVAEQLVGRKARATIGHREWQGVDRNEVKAVKARPGFANPTPTVAAGPSAPGATPGVSTGPVAPGGASATGPKGPAF